MSQALRDAGAARSFLARFDTFLFDCDGVLWSGDHVFEGTVETLEKLRAMGAACSLMALRVGKRIIFVTNNSTKSRADYCRKLQSLGIPATPEEVFSSSYSASIYISKILALPPNKRKVFVIGETGIEQELRCENIHTLGGSHPDFDRKIEAADYERLASGKALDPEVGVVLVGLDHYLNYLKLAHAYHYIVQRGAIFLATNMDTTLPSCRALFPGAGACAAPLIAMLNGQRPEQSGKPSQKMLDAIEAKFTLDRRRTCMVGDRLDTDIAFGNSGGLGGTLCVLTGVTKSPQDWEQQDEMLRPSAWIPKLGDLLVE